MQHYHKVYSCLRVHSCALELIKDLKHSSSSFYFKNLLVNFFLGSYGFVLVFVHQIWVLPVGLLSKCKDSVLFAWLSAEMLFPKKGMRLLAGNWTFIWFEAVIYRMGNIIILYFELGTACYEFI